MSHTAAIKVRRTLRQVTKSYPLLCGLLAAFIVVTPLTHKGWLLLLDSSPGPALKLPRSLVGLDGGLTAAAPYIFVRHLLADIFGPATIAWLPIPIFFVLAFLGMARLFPKQPTLSMPAAAFYTFTPVVLERTWVGHQAYLIGYALLPFILSAAMKAIEAKGFQRLGVVPWIAIAAGMGVHYLWLGGLILLCVVATRRVSIQTLSTLGLTLLFLILSSFYLFSSIQDDSGNGISVGVADVQAYQTQGDKHLGLFGNVAALYGYWRSEPPLPKNIDVFWPLLILVCTLVIAIGVWSGWKDEKYRKLVQTSGLFAVIAFFLALGTQGPTGSLYLWAFHHMPGFNVMREPQKFVALVALFYSIAFGLGARHLINGVKEKRSVAIAFAVALCVLPVATTPEIVWGYNHDLKVSRYPTDWRQANKIMGKGIGKALVLPWHEYAGFGFTQGRHISQPANDFFDRPVIQGDNVELPGAATTSLSAQSAYVTWLLSAGGSTQYAGHLLAPLGVQYVLLQKENDWDKYTWLSQQSDMKTVLDSKTIVVFQNTAYFGAGKHVSNMQSINSYADLLNQSPSSLENTAYVFASQRDLTTTATTTSSDNTNIQQISDVQYAVAPSISGVDLVSEQFDPGWKMQHAHIERLATGTIAVVGPHSARTLTFTTWSKVKGRYLLSLLTILLVICALRVRVQPHR